MQRTTNIINVDNTLPPAKIMYSMKSNHKWSVEIDSKCKQLCVLTFHLWLDFIHDFSLEEWYSCDILLDWNEKLYPPWPFEDKIVLPCPSLKILKYCGTVWKLHWIVEFFTARLMDKGDALTADTKAAPVKMMYEIQSQVVTVNAKWRICVLWFTGHFKFYWSYFSSSKNYVWNSITSGHWRRIQNGRCKPCILAVHLCSDHSRWLLIPGLNRAKKWL